MKKILEWIKPLVIALIIALVINNFVLFNGIIPTSSMEPTLNVKDRVFALRLSYTFTEPERGDIVIFESNHSDIYLVKRLIGLPGDSIEIKNGSVYVNGELLDEPYLTAETIGNLGPYDVPEDGYFMMGDNRTNSNDSRYWTNPYVKKDEIVGKVFIKYFPKIKYLGGNHG